MKRTKIVCTIGPASEKRTTLTAMMKAGMNVARLNFSHGTHAGHKKLLRAIRGAAKAAGQPVAILGDLQGPKIRLGELPEAGVKLKKGSRIELSTAIEAYKENGPLPVTYKNLHKDVKPGERFLIDDGLLALEIESVHGRVITAAVVNGGTVTSHKGMNFPDSSLSVSAITEKDRKDLIFGVQEGVDWIALSFVTSVKEIKLLRKLIKKAGKRGQTLPRIIVKIEKHEAIDRFDEILAAVDGVMIARGDLGIEIPAEDVPVRQKEIIEKCRLAGKPVVVATQMMDSMIRNPRPTRAEVSDVANAVFDHTDAVMLSGESATGKYPLEAVKMLAKIVEKAEVSPFDDVEMMENTNADKDQRFAAALHILALTGEIDAIVACRDMAPWSEKTLLMHPEIPCFLASADETMVRQNTIRWGMRPLALQKGKGDCALRALSALKRKKSLKKGSRVAMILGSRHGKGFRIEEI